MLLFRPAALHNAPASHRVYQQSFSRVSLFVYIDTHAIVSRSMDFSGNLEARGSSKIPPSVFSKLNRVNEISNTKITVDGTDEVYQMEGIIFSGNIDK